MKTKLFLLSSLAGLGLIMSGCAHHAHHAGCGHKKENPYQCSAKKDTCTQDSCGCKDKATCECGDSCECPACAAKKADAATEAKPATKTEVKKK